MSAPIRLRGQKELVRAFTKAGKDSGRFIRAELATAAQPVADSAERLSLAHIRKIGPRWSRMRVGVTQKLVYVVPAQSGGRGPKAKRRPNLARLMGPLMDQALDENEAKVIEGVNRALENIEREWGSD